MNILLIGRSGQVGNEVYKLLAKNHSVRSFSSSELDLRDGDKILDKFKNLSPDFVINAAAYTNVNSAEKNITLARSINASGVKNLAQTCRKFSIPLCHLSTDYVFDGNTNHSYKEDDLPRPINSYGRSKLEGEEIIRDLLNEHLIIRTSWVFGNGKNFVKTILELAKNQKEISVIDNQFGGPTSSLAIARCIAKITEQYDMNKDIAWGTYHFCGLPETSWNYFAKEICRKAKKKKILNFKPLINSVTSESYKDIVKRPANSYLNCNKIFSNFGIKQPSWKHDLDEYLDNLNEG